MFIVLLMVGMLLSKFGKFGSELLNFISLRFEIGEESGNGFITFILAELVLLGGCFFVLVCWLMLFLCFGIIRFVIWHGCPLCLNRHIQ